MSEAFQVVAAMPDRDRATVLRLAEEIGAIFGVDLSGLLDALSDTGVCVDTAPTLVEARQMGAQIIGVGADFRVLDAAGVEIEAQEAARPVIESRRPAGGDAQHRTMMGGFDSPEMMLDIPPPRKLELDGPGGFADTASTIGEGAVEVGAFEAPAAASALELEDGGGFAAVNARIADGAVSIGGGPSGKLELESDGGYAATNARIGEGAVDLGVQPDDELELEGGGVAAADSTIADGALEMGAAVDQPDGELELEGSGGFAAANSTVAEGGVEFTDDGNALELSGPGGFAAPATARDGFALDALDADALVLLDGSEDEQATKSRSPELASPGRPGPEQATTGSAVLSIDEDARFRAPDAALLEAESALELEEPLPAQSSGTHPSVAGATTSGSYPALGGAGTSGDYPAPDGATSSDGYPTPDRSGELERMPGASAAGATGEAPSAAASGEPAIGGGLASTPAARARSRAARPPSGPLLLGGRIRQHPRVRVAIGFLLAVGLGSLLPMCHARSVRRSRIEPLRIDLATAKAHGSLMSSTAAYRTPAQIEGTIDSIRTRHAIYSVLMWSVLAALLLFLWFRFT